MILDRDPIVLPCAPCPRRFLLSPVARAWSPVWGWRSWWPPGCSCASGPARASGSTRRSPSTSPACRCTRSPNALKHDGAPPLYYYLLHFWIGLFGQSNDAVRALSGVIAVLTLPVAWLCGKRFGGRAVAWTMLVLLASAPFAVYYATESRMYALVILLTGCGFLALQRAIERAAAGQPHRGGRRDGRAALHPVLVALPRRRGRASGSSSPSCAPGAAGAPRTRRWAALHRRGRGRPALRALAADVPLPDQAHGDAVGRAAELLRRDQRPHRLHRQPGFDAADRRPTRAACSPSSTSPCWPWPCSGRADRPHHRARPAHPAARPRRRLRRGRARCSPPSPAASSPERVLARATPPWSSCRSCSSSRWARRRCSTPRCGWSWSALAVVGRARVVGPERDDAADPGRRGGGGHQHAGQAGRRHRLLPRPARARRSTARSQDPSQYDMITFPRRTGPADRRLGRLRRGGPRRPSPAAFADDVAHRAGDRSPRLAGLAARCTRPTASSARRSPRPPGTRPPRAAAAAATS